MNRLWNVVSSVRLLFILVPLLCESMFDDICSSVVHSLPDSPFSLISPLTLSNHLILGLPLFRTLPSSFFLCSALLFSSYARTSSAFYIGVPLRFLPLLVHRSRIISFLILSTLVTSHIHHSNFFYCAFCNVPARTYHCHVQLPLASPRSFSVTQLSIDSLPVLPTVLHAEGDFGIQSSIFP